MAETASPQRSPALGQGTTNTTPGSQVIVKVKPEPQAYLRLDTGEVCLVPATDVTELNNEFDAWNRRIYEQLLANEVLALADERLLAISQAKFANKFAVSNAIEEDARKSQQFALQWREQATQNLHAQMQALDKLGGSGKKLIEMVPLMEKEGAKPYAVVPGKDNGQWKRKGLDLSKAWNVRSAVGIRDKFTQEARYKGIGPMRYMSSEKLKSSWPQFKDKKPGGTKWVDVYKPDASGKRKLDRQKLRTYLGEQVQQAKLQSTDFVKLEVEYVTTLGPEALAKWNDNCQAHAEGKAVWGDTQLADIDLSAQAAAMRFLSGGSLSGEIVPLQGSLNLKAEGSVEVAFAEGKAAGSLYLPSKEGVMLYYLDLEQLVDMGKGNAVDAGRYDLGAIRLVCSAELKGVVGVSLAGEVSIGVEMKDVETTDVDGQVKAGRMPRLKGSSKKARRCPAVDVAGQADDWKNTAGVAANINFFAGAKGGIGFKGAIEWRNPHTAEKKFEPFASIAPELQAMAGLAGEAKLNIEYTDGIFRITAHAGLCFGIGAEGTVTFAVGVKQLASFIYWVYYNLLHLEFKNAEFISRTGFQALRQLGYLMVCEGKTIEAYFGAAERVLEDAVQDWGNKFAKADACLKLGNQILARPEAVRFCPPESKGMLIYQLTRFSGASWVADGGGLFDSYLPTQRRAVLAVLRQTQLKSDIENVIQHIGQNGGKSDFHRNLESLKRFFAAEGPGGVDVPGSRTGYQDSFQSLMRDRGFGTGFTASTQPADKMDAIALNGDFGRWYEQVHASLMDEPIRGIPAMANSDLAYALARDGGRGDHPLFASSDGGFYKSTA